MRRVRDLRVELHAVEPALVVGDDGVGRGVAGADGAESRRQGGDAVAVAHPDLLAPARLPSVLEQPARPGDVHEGAAELAVFGHIDLAAELRAHGLLPVADAQHRHAR